ncbi:MAG: hypothetical protein EBX51_08095, partial [Acidimicrobiia bacterium]|nr:hypothetical protein [Acidimicrobiia bacterium]
AGDMATPEPIGALLLAAGGGSRFVGATHKLLAPLGGQPVVRHVLEAVARSGLSPIIVVTGAVDLGDELTREPPGHPRLVQVHHPQWQRGMASSLHVGFDEARRLCLAAVVVGWAINLASRRLRGERSPTRRHHSRLPPTTASDATRCAFTPSCGRTCLTKVMKVRAHCCARDQNSSPK